MKYFNPENSIFSNSFLIEGLEIDPENKSVRLTDRHSKGLNTNIFSNPVHYKFKGYDVYSIFRRTSYDLYSGYDIDGNPFIKALKGLDGWKFDMSREEILKYIRRFFLIANKIPKNYDTIITIPSKHDLNFKFMSSIKKVVGSTWVFSDLFCKCSKEEAWESIDYDAISRDYKNRFSKEQVMREIYASLGKMDYFFEAKHMKKKYLKYFKSIISYNSQYTIKDLDQYITDKNVLILDDTISSGMTVSSATDAIVSDFRPKSVTIITLLSRLESNIGLSIIG